MAFRIGFVPGVTLRKWTTAWEDRRPDVALDVIPLGEDEAVPALHEGRLDVAFVRLPVATDGLSVIRLYGERQVLVAPKDPGPAPAVETLLEARPPIADVIELVAAGVGTVVLPHSIARLHARKDVVAIDLPDAAETEIALAWPAAATTPDVEQFIGIVRGRTARSSRDAAPAAVAAKEPVMKKAPLTRLTPKKTVRRSSRRRSR